MENINKSFAKRLKKYTDKELLAEAQSFKVLARVYTFPAFHRNYNTILRELKNRGLMK